MFLISRLLQAARSWRHRSGPKAAKRSAIAVEQLDQRQLLSVNFTGNVALDFPATQQPGVVIFNSSNTPNIQHPIIPPQFGQFLPSPPNPPNTPNPAYIPTSGFDLSEIRVSYDSTTDTLSIGLNQPPANIPSNPTGPVIAGDADDNGNAGTVNPAVTAVDPLFTDFFALGGSDEMAAFLDFTNSGVPGIVAGFSPTPPPATPTDPSPQKPYEVAIAIPNSSNPRGIPTFGTPLPGNTGNYYLQNSAAHPNLEFNIAHFSQLYLSETGKALTPTSAIGIGGFAGSLDDGGISDAFFPESTFTLSQATVPVPPPTMECSPPILINPHEHRIIDTSHRDLVRVSIFGTSGFPVSEINPATVELDGAHAVAHITRKVHRDEFPFQTYVFVANQLNLPAGLTTATLTGETYNGVPFQSQREVLNIKGSAKVFGQLKKYMGNASIYERLIKIEKRNSSAAISVNSTPVTAVSQNPAAKGAAAIKVDYTPKVSAAGKMTRTAETVKVRPVVSITHGDAALERTNVPTRLRHSMNDYLS
jgi:hypothetical protein